MTEKRTLKDLGLIFDPSSGCNSCDYNICSDRVIHILSGNEFYLVIRILDDGTYAVQACISQNSVSSEDFEHVFVDEPNVVEYLEDNFLGFGCF